MLSDLIRDIKANSSHFINKKNWVRGKFEWQHGFGAFTLGQSQVVRIINYISNQEEHHKKRTFKEEYIEFLRLYRIDYKPEFIFEEVV